MTDSLVCESDIDKESSRSQQKILKCAIITPVGPGHEPLYQQCIESAARAYAHSKGSFTDIVSIKIDDAGHVRIAELIQPGFGILRLVFVIQTDDWREILFRQSSNDFVLGATGNTP